MRRLILLRHAKSAWPDVADRDRPLAKRGQRQAPLTGAWLRSAGHLPDLVLCSPARRTRDTWQLVAAAFGASPGTVSYEERIYGAGAASLLALVREVPASVTTLLLVGHSPGLPGLAAELAGAGHGGSEPGALHRLRLKFPTAATAVLGVPGEWRDLTPGGARLTDFVVPRDLER